jgi:hypothetical protein
MSSTNAFAVVRSWMASKLNTPKAVIDALERFIADKGVGFREMADLPAHTVIGRDSASAGQPQAVSITGGIEFTGSGSIQRSALVGDVTAPAGSTTTTIAPHAVTNGKFRQSAGLSIVGNSTNATADVADIAAASDGQVMRRSGTAIGFGAVDLTSTNAVTGALGFAHGGTGQSSYTDGQLLIGNTSTGGLSKATLTAGSNVTITNAGGSITIDASGGTGNRHQRIFGQRRPQRRHRDHHPGPDHRFRAEADHSPHHRHERGRGVVHQLRWVRECYGGRDHPGQRGYDEHDQ